jgi:general stress protein 26
LARTAPCLVPEGKDDPDIAVLRVDISQAEYWDAPSSTMLHLWGYAKAVTTGMRS